MNFIDNASAEIVGGIVGGLVVLLLPSIIRYFGLFELRFLIPKEIVAAEHMNKFTALAVPIGKSTIRFCIRPRQGILLSKFNIAFFDMGNIPLRHGRRLNEEDVEVNGMRYLKNNNVWEKLSDFEIGHDYVLANLSNIPEAGLASGKRSMFELDIDIDKSLKNWQGIFAVQIIFMRDGNPDKRNIHSKMFVYNIQKRKPFRTIGKKILFLENKDSNLKSVE